MHNINNETVPNFCWDRNLTVGQIRAQLRGASGFQWVQIASWILREAALTDVWTFLSPQEIQTHLSELDPFLGRRREFWKYILGAWHELGRI